jgi:KTSC domain-containing protein
VGATHDQLRTSIGDRQALERSSHPGRRRVMQREPVSSSAVQSVGYHDGTLEIEFASGNVYQYFDVPERLSEELTDAASIGSFFNEQIRGYFRYARV